MERSRIHGEKSQPPRTAFRCGALKFSSDGQVEVEVCSRRPGRYHRRVETLCGSGTASSPIDRKRRMAKFESDQLFLPEDSIRYRCVLVRRNRALPEAAGEAMKPSASLLVVKTSNVRPGFRMVVVPSLSQKYN